ncbi:YbaY family lipoprotein [Pseudomonas sp. Irchel s3h17]|uniref:YbaY family lipoprotein n=1 Tax=Pseudomonas sp. Irchel s3h17 TaxID=2009182 RepID=UPI000BA2C012|nr:YbaY family lipoprotein [Pseudomonas sp. Irchel s3h17]
MTEHYYSIPCKAYYLERIALLPNSALYASLQDVSLADAPAREIAHCVIPDASEAGLCFEFSVPASAVIDGHSYAISVRIEANNELIFITQDRHSVDPCASYLQPLDILVRRA